MTVFLMAVAYGLLKTGSLIALLVGAYTGWDLVLEKLCQPSPYLPLTLAIPETIHSQTHLETCQNRLSRFFYQHPQPGQPAQAAPGGEHQPGLA
jgi:hypothetical protein